MRLPSRPLTVLGGLLLLALLVLLGSPAMAQQPVSDDDVNEIAKQLFCPVCENTPLDVCATQACQDWRDEIRTQLADGRTEAEIHQYFVDRYGAKVLSTPPQEGFNLLIWILPVVLAVGGAIFFYLYLRNLQTRRTATSEGVSTVAQGGAQAPPPVTQEDEYRSRVEKELRE